MKQFLRVLTFLIIAIVVILTVIFLNNRNKIYQENGNNSVLSGDVIDYLEENNNDNLDNSNNSGDNADIISNEEVKVSEDISGDITNNGEIYNIENSGENEINSESGENELIDDKEVLTSGEIETISGDEKNI